MEVRSSISTVTGFKVAGVHAGLKADGALDFALIVSDTPCVTAGVFTTNQVKAAPVLVDMDKLAKNPNGIRAVAVNTKCANACTGQQGIDNAHEMARLVAVRLGFSEDEVLVLSTGVIGTQLPMDKIKHGVALAADALGSDWAATARAIMTTDTRPKSASFVSPHGYQIAGIAKGAGMIAPNMATMLSVMVSDAALTDAAMGQRLLKSAADVSFNSVAVDGDTSTNDTLLLLANGAAKSWSNESVFAEELREPAIKLAHDIVRDGEGATKFIEIRVSGTLTHADARKIADTIATSPLVKTAFYGADANWGRILAAAGRAGVTLDSGRLSLSIAPLHDASAAVQLIANGQPTSYSEAVATAIMQQTDIRVDLDCGLAQTSPVIVWTCDLSHDYVSINGHYRS